jgi:predicted GNAT family N-acyltransferase
MRGQNVPEELEWDGEDDKAIHLLASDEQGGPIGCARILHDGHIGRMAVLQPWRGRGVGTALLKEALQVVKGLDHDAAFLDAQCDAIPFYQRLGFQAEGDKFLDAGIPHRHMYRVL